MEKTYAPSHSDSAKQDYISELESARALNRKLQRELKKAQDDLAEARRAHTLMVNTLTETTRENTVLEIERDMWKARAQKNGVPDPQCEEDIMDSLGVGPISKDEARAIRKAMARLHHPDTGGNAERMKMWNATLDRIEQGS